MWIMEKKVEATIQGLGSRDISSNNGDSTLDTGVQIRNPCPSLDYLGNVDCSSFDLYHIPRKDPIYVYMYIFIIYTYIDTHIILFSLAVCRADS